MRHPHNAHRLVIALLLGTCVLGYVLSSRVMIIIALAAVLCLEWHGLVRFFHVGQMTLAKVERSSLRIPKRWELVSTNLLTVLFLVLSVQFISQVYAMAFTLSTSTTESSTTIRVFTGDFDGDGDIDYIALNSNASEQNLDLYKNDGTGVFTRSAFGTSQNVVSARAGDIDNDGDLDLLVAETSTVKKYVNDGTGTFTSSTILSTGDTIREIILADLNNDGSLDYIYTATSTVTSYYINNGHGSFSAANTSIPASTGIAAADMDSDGDLDLAFSNGSTIRIYRNSGSGAFTAFSSFALGNAANEILTADLDQDGDVDLAIAQSGGGGLNDLSMMKNDGNGTFSNLTTKSTSQTLRLISLSDLDNDGDVDIIAAGSGVTGSKIWYNDGAGGFTSSGSESQIETTRDVAVGDIDGDGDLDYIRGNDGVNRHYRSDQAATLANAAPSAPSTGFGTVVNASHNTITAVDTAGGVGQYNALAIGADDLPVIAYFDATNRDLKVMKCGNAACTHGNTLTTVDSTNDAGYYPSIAVPADGLPVISYEEGSAFDIKFVKCGNASCSSGNTLSTIDSPNNVAGRTSIAIGNDGYPVITYNDNSTSSLMVAKCSSATCASGVTITTVDSTIGTSADGISSIAVPSSDGFPIISYYDTASDNLKVVKCGNASCSSGNTITTLDSAGNTGADSFILAPPDDRPIISYWDVTNGDLKLARCADASCTSASLVTVVSAGSNGQNTSMALSDDGFPIIAHLDGTNGDLKIAKCADASCSSGTTITTVDTGGFMTNDTSIAIPNDGLPVVSYYHQTNADLRVLKCADVACASGGSDGFSLRMTWGSGSDALTPTKQLQYRIRIGTGSSTSNISSGLIGSPSFVTRMMPNGQSRSMVLKGVQCGTSLTYYWSVATVDLAYAVSGWSAQQSFTVDSACSVGAGGGGGGSSTTGAGGSTLWNINRSRADSGGGGELLRLVVSAISDVNGNHKRDSREQLLSLRGLPVTASGTSVSGVSVRKTVLMSGTGVAIFELPPSGKRGYVISFDSGALADLGYVSTGASSQSGVVLTSAASTSVLATVTLPLRRSDLLRYAPCLTVGLQSERERQGTDAEIFLQRLRDPYAKGILSGVTFSGALMSRGDFFVLLQRTQCVPLVTDRSLLLKKLQKAIVTLGGSLSLVDLPLNGTADSLSIYSLVGSGADVTRETSIGPAADLSSPITRRDAIRAVASLLRLQGSGSTQTGADLLPEDIDADDVVAKDFLALKKLGVLPDSFVSIPGFRQGVTPAEAALLLSRAAFRNGKITLLPDIEDLKSLKSAAKKTPLVPTFLAELPALRARECLLRTESRASSIAFTDLLPGDTMHADIRDLLMRGTKNAADQILWLLPATRRPTEFGILHGEAKVATAEPVSLIETIRALLVLNCIPPDTRLQAMLGLSSKEVIQGSMETRVSRDRLSDLPRDASFASRVLYRAQDHQKEFDLSLISYASNIERAETRSPASGLNVQEGSDLLASALLVMLVNQGSISPQKADLIASSVSSAISRDLLGKELNWRDEGLLVRTPLTREMLLKYLATVVQNKRHVSLVSKVSSTLSLGDIWWERLK